MTSKMFRRGLIVQAIIYGFILIPYYVYEIAYRYFGQQHIEFVFEQWGSGLAFTLVGLIIIIVLVAIGTLTWYWITEK